MSTTIATRDHVAAFLDELSTDQLLGIAVELAERLHHGRSTPTNVCEAGTRLAGAAMSVAPEAVAGTGRHQSVSDARAIAQAAARNHGLTLQTIAAHWGQHHTSVMYAVRKVESTPALRSIAARVTAELTAHLTGGGA